MAFAIDTNEKVYTNKEGWSRHIFKNEFYQDNSGSVIYVMNFAQSETGETLVVYHEVDDILSVHAEPLQTFAEFTIHESFRFKRIASLKGREILTDVISASEESV